MEKNCSSGLTDIFLSTQDLTFLFKAIKCVCENICTQLIMSYQAVVASSYLAVARVAESCSGAELVLIRHQIHRAGNRQPLSLISLA